MFAEFEVSSYRDKEWSENFKSRSRDPFLTLFDIILHFFSLVSLVVTLLAKFEVSRSKRSRYIKESQNFKSRSCDPFRPPVDLILHLFR